MPPTAKALALAFLVTASAVTPCTAQDVLAELDWFNAGGTASQATPGDDNGQTFVAGRGGQLTTLEMVVTRDPAATGNEPFTVELWSTEPSLNGPQPDTLLATGMLPADDPQWDTILLTWKQITMTPEVHLDRGTTYALLVFSLGPDTPYDLLMRSPSQYVAGHAFQKNPAGSVWVPQNRDHGFRLLGEADAEPDLGLPDDYWVVHDGSGTRIGTADDVSSGGDACTLRDALGVADDGTVELGCQVYEVGSPGADAPYAILLPAEPFTYTLASSTLSFLSGRAWVIGAGPGTSIVQAQEAESLGAEPEQVFVVGGDQLYLHGMTIRHGSTTGSGGGILVGLDAELTVDNCHVEDNHADGDGGGIARQPGSPPKIRRSIIRRNTAGGRGGGVAGSFDIRDSVIAENQATDGGGLESSAASILENSTVAFNRALVDGGGWFDRAAGRVVGVSFIGNEAESGDGGGVFIDDTQTSFNNCTVAMNTAAGRGGGILVGTGAADASLYNVTVATNGAGVGGGGIASEGTPLQYANSLIADNVSPAGEDCDLPAGSATSLGHNVLGASCPGGGTGDQVGVAAGLGVLGDHGGPTLPDGTRPPTFSLASSSPAIDAGDPAGCTGEDAGGPFALDVDQRGVSRQDGDGDGETRCDAGAYELVLVVFADGFESGDLSGWSAAVP